MPPIVTVTANLDGSGQRYVVQGWDDAGTSVSINGHLLWSLDGSKGQLHILGPGPANPPNSGWGRHTVDLFLVGDVDGDGKDEIILVNKGDGWIGIVKWNGTSLTYTNGSSPPIKGPGAANPPGSGWRIDPVDNILLADCDNDGRAEVILWNNNDLWTGLLTCNTNPVSYVWGESHTISGPGGTWNRRGSDSFSAGVYQDKKVIIANSPFDPKTAYLQFEGAALQVVAMDGSPPAPAIGNISSTDTSIMLNWTGPSPSTFDGQYDLLWYGPGDPGTLGSTSANTYKIEGLTPGTAYSVEVWYQVDGLKSAIARAFKSTTGSVPPPPLVVVPEFIGQSLAHAFDVLNQIGLKMGVVLNPSNELRTDHLKVIQQSPSAGNRVSPGASIGMTVTALPGAIVGFSQIVVINENTDGRAVQVFLIDLADAIPKSMGLLALNGSQALALQDGHTYEIVVVDVGLNGCPGADPTNVSCQRSKSFANGLKNGPAVSLVVS